MNYKNELTKNNPIAFKILDNAFNNNKVPHAYLFSASNGQEIKNESLYLIQRLISKNELRDPLSYSDLIIISGTEKLIKKEFISQALIDLSQTPLDSAGIKILLIENIENSNKQSINSLLKFLEDPTKDTYIIMTTNQISSVLETIRSRSQIIKLRPIKKEKLSNNLQNLGIEQKFAHPISAISSSVEVANKIYKDNFKEIYEDIIIFLNSSIKDKNNIVLLLSRILTKKSSKIIVSLLREFFNDIWRIKEITTITFKSQEKLIEEYLSSDFNYQKAIKELSHFEVMLSKNVNFDLFKNKLLINLEECYV